MEQNLTPLELARQTLIKLSKNQSPPTPENYRRVYEEISGIKSTNHSAILNTTLEKVLQEKSKSNPQYSTAAKKIAILIEKQDTTNLEAQLRTLLPDDTAIDNGINWGTLLRYLLKQLDANHHGLTLSRKKDGLNQVIVHFGNNSTQLGQKIQALITSWGDGQAGIETTAIAQTETESSPPTATPTPTETFAPTIVSHVSDREKEKLVATAWRDMLIRTINLVVVPQFTEIPSAISRIEALIKRAQSAETVAEVDKLNEALKSTLLRAEMQNDSQQRMQEALIQILRLLVSSMGELTIEDKWLHGQLAIVQEIISKPLNIDAVYNAESSLKELIFKQNIKPGLLAAKETLRSMVSTFVSRLADITVSTGSYQTKIQIYHDQINATEDITKLSNILENLVGDISAMNEDAKQNHEALQETQKKVEVAEKQIHELTVKLDYISEVAHEDFLTGALNRRGMDEASLNKRI
jgi:diguanylate cyclase